MHLERLLQENHRSQSHSVEQLFCNQPDRQDLFSLHAGPAYFDYSKQLLDQRGLDLLVDLAHERDLTGAVRALVDGVSVNQSENRPALHTALRSGVGDSEISRRARAKADEGRRQVRKIASSVRSGELRSVSGHRFDHVVNIGIGGSDVGPRLVVSALDNEERSGSITTHFVANIDGHGLEDVLASVIPGRTLFCVVSKSFGTRETLINARSARSWLARELGIRESEAGSDFLAVTANIDRAQAFGIERDRILPMWDWVGGRFSLWSPCGVAVAIGLGADVFEQLLAGAAQADEHLVNAPVECNLPMIQALLGYWHRTIAGTQAYGVVAYHDRLGRLGDWLQQLDMESNGKSVSGDGRRLGAPAGPVCFGGIGTNAQHAFFQWVHQSVDVLPLDLIGFRHGSDRAPEEHHRELSANLIAQSWALAVGRSPEQTAAELGDDLRQHASFVGSRPHNLWLFDRLDPQTLGFMLATLEHKIYLQGVLWGVNSFDQWGVELGKRLADKVLPALDTGTMPEGADPSTLELIRYFRSNC